MKAKKLKAGILYRSVSDVQGYRQILRYTGGVTHDGEYIFEIFPDCTTISLLKGVSIDLLVEVDNIRRGPCL
jgi:hypothetical protein